MFTKIFPLVPAIVPSMGPDMIAMFEKVKEESRAMSLVVANSQNADGMVDIEVIIEAAIMQGLVISGALSITPKTTQLH
jgi:hypothetical protein